MIASCEAIIDTLGVLDISRAALLNSPPCAEHSALSLLVTKVKLWAFVSTAAYMQSQCHGKSVLVHHALDLGEESTIFSAHGVGAAAHRYCRDP